ncbi:MAG: isocitrate lyase/phosphoenolpyruvate mutase family protein [Xanthobacteraceae bacterium]|nr:isocitrate lyase/phosphoenolpyruvate mutase family protein [Xanthobacteraceae bacterium]
MTKDRQKQLADTFRAMHRGPLLLMPNAWDAMSARQFEAAGFPAIATTSGGVAWALGHADGEKAPWHEIVSATERVVRTVRVPVTADIEGGYGDSAAEVGKNIAEVVRTGIVGFNLEDGTPRPDMPVRPIEDAVARIRAAREAAANAGIPAVINARIDLYLKNVGDPAGRFDETVKRAKAYLAAGADCIYPFGLIDMDTVGRLAKAIPAPINIVARAGTPPVTELQKLGVARITIASGATLAVMSLIKTIGEGLRATGTFDGIGHSMNRPEAQKLFEPRG